MAGQCGHRAVGNRQGLPEPRRGLRTWPGQLRLREGHATGALGLRPDDQRQQSPNFEDTRTGRQGLEPITPAQGGQVAASLNLHHPYDPANPIDSIAVAARAINDIIGGATLTGTDGNPVVQSGLEGKSRELPALYRLAAWLPPVRASRICALTG